MRRAARRDQNEPSLIAAARQLGWLMVRLDTPCDWLGHLRGCWWPIECKGARGRYTPAQQVFLSQAKRHGAAVLTWRTLDDVLQATEMAHGW